ncbi:MAG TPA: hypothetical protein VF277_08235, partial [Steroidobacteraceae bacterium]
MKPLASALLPIALGLAACASLVPAPAGTVLPDAARQTPDHFLVVTVRNDGVSGGVRAASTARGYDGVAAYTASSVARSTAHAIAADYRLHEAASWPIALLGVHCIVYELPEAGDSRALVQRLEHDRRVESVQPLAAFAT